MKKIFLMLIGVALLFTGCLGSKTTLDLADELEKQEGNYLSTTDNYFNPSERKFIKEGVSGLLSVAVYDFTSDGEDDVLVSKVLDNNLVLDLYKNEDDSLKKVDSLVVFEDYLDSPDTIFLDCFVKKVDNKPYVFVESTTYSNLIGDGIGWEVKKIGFNNDDLVEVLYESFNGSYFDDETISDKLTTVKHMGITAEKISFDEDGSSLFEQNKNSSVMMFQIERDHLEDFDYLKYEDSSETKVKYGTTIYTNKFKDNKEIETYLK